MEANKRCIKCMSPLTDEGPCKECGFDASGYETDKMYLQPGSFIRNRYLIGVMLHATKYCASYMGWDNFENMKVVIKEYFPQDISKRDTSDGEKFIHPVSGRDEDYRQGMQNYERVGKRIEIFNEMPGITSVHDIINENNTIYVIYKYGEGEDTDALIAKNSHIRSDVVLKMMNPVIASLGRIHKSGTYHLNICPKNVILDLKKKEAVLINFDVAHATSNNILDIDQDPGYAPPEELDPDGKVGPFTDVYGMCATLYFMITGIVPPDSESREKGEVLKTFDELNIKFDKAKQDAILKGLSLKPEDRFQSMLDLSDILKKEEVKPIPAPASPSGNTGRINTSAVNEALLGGSSQASAGPDSPGAPASSTKQEALDNFASLLKDDSYGQKPQKKSRFFGGGTQAPQGSAAGSTYPDRPTVGAPTPASKSEALDNFASLLKEDSANTPQPQSRRRGFFGIGGGSSSQAQDDFVDPLEAILNDKNADAELRNAATRKAAATNPYLNNQSGQQNMNTGMGYGQPAESQQAAYTVPMAEAYERQTGNAPQAYQYGMQSVNAPQPDQYGMQSVNTPQPDPYKNAYDEDSFINENPAQDMNAPQAAPEAAAGAAAQDAPEEVANPYDNVNEAPEESAPAESAAADNAHAEPVNDTSGAEPEGAVQTADNTAPAEASAVTSEAAPADAAIVTSEASPADAPAETSEVTTSDVPAAEAGKGERKAEAAEEKTAEASKTSDGKAAANAEVSADKLASLFNEIDKRPERNPAINPAPTKVRYTGLGVKTAGNDSKIPGASSAAAPGAGSATMNSDLKKQKEKDEAFDNFMAIRNEIDNAPAQKSSVRDSLSNLGSNIGNIGTRIAKGVQGTQAQPKPVVDESLPDNKDDLMELFIQESKETHGALAASKAEKKSRFYSRPSKVVEPGGKPASNPAAVLRGNSQKDLKPKEDLPENKDDLMDLFIRESMSNSSDQAANKKRGLFGRRK
jgi:serine/threonine protein kinase